MKNRLFINLALTFLVLIVVLGIIIGYVSFYTAEEYYEESNQKLNAKLAQYTADHNVPFKENDSIDVTAIQDIMHSMMVINPDVEVYLLDPNGNILTHVAPYKEVVRNQVDVGPVLQFIESKGENFVKGDDPRNFNKQKVFSAAPVVANDILKGYFYIILASEERSSVLQAHSTSMVMQLACRLIILSIIGSLLLGLLAFWWQTRSLSKIISAVQEFKKGYYSSRVAPISDSAFSTIGSTFNEMASQIQSNIEKIESIESFRKELIANVSHDLRTPLAIIQGYTETLLIKNDVISDHDKVKYLENINESSKRLAGLVNQLFELSKLENNQVELQKEPFHLSELAQDLVSRFELLAAKKNISLSLIQKNDLPLAFGDISLVERVIQNLLENAIKYTPEDGNVFIDVGSEDQNLTFRITDDGHGIPTENMTAIFERFKTVKRDGDKSQGTGLGLAIANRILELHDSTIRVTSKLNVGTSFYFNLPVYHA
jgi:signal transduction histidine kinase